jgi:hypothetical protein
MGQRMQNGDTFAVGLLEEVPKVTGRLSVEDGFQVEEIGDWLSSSLEVEKAEEEYQLDPFPLQAMLMLMLYEYDADAYAADAVRIGCRC